MSAPPGVLDRCSGSSSRASLARAAEPAGAAVAHEAPDRYLAALGWVPAHAELSRGRRIGLIDGAVDATSALLPREAAIIRRRFDADGALVPDDAPATAPDGHGTKTAAALLSVAPHAIIEAIALPVAFGEGRGSGLALLHAIVALAVRDVDVICINAASRLLSGFAHAFAAPRVAVQALTAYRDEVAYYRALGQLLETRIVDAPLLVSGTGNDSEPGLRLPAAHPASAWGTLAVGAVDAAPDAAISTAAARALSDFSHAGGHVVAPGRLLLPRHAGAPAPFVGTSAAAALVAGVAALWAGHLGAGRAHREPLRAKLVGHARADLLAPNADPDLVGAGLVQVPLPCRR